jgi:predicted O-methyltransferase YrrM
MTRKMLIAAGLVLALTATAAPASPSSAGQTAQVEKPRGGPELDRKVQAFLESHARQWRDMNVPEADGRILYDLVLENKYTRALEIGTSTGHSGIWIAWALSKTGGKLITVDIDEDRHREAVANFREAGLSDIIDARLADAHDLVGGLSGPFDFVFIDADKEWYDNYARAVIPKLAPGGCIAAHNVYESRGGWGRGGASAYFAFMKSRPEFDTRILPGGSGSLSVSYKIK